ncbi:glycosyltransferase family 2 protein [Flammeovirga pectinis]|uniref:Glycosyltransferase family 2 protein n=1 Tax=Flammeovirga pectinis TaxID=2494373 RepID=A0A3S9P038_9BACT|nr:glycosyltransferase family 2 protein [Flammeovirga pectinis]AZQ61551.1 glycosyltransferase family 2 protein [Flammeovirga pectinis]
MYNDGLSIVIPSYNRKEQLIKVLDSIFSQDITTLYEVVVIDNCSDYNISEFYTHEKLRIIRNNINVGMSTNIVNPFLHCKTKWMWILSDDDITLNNSINIINNKIKDQPNNCAFKFSTEGTSTTGLEKDLSIKSLQELINYYKFDKKIRRGNLVFISNNVLNLETLYPYLGKAFEYSYTFIGHLIPIFYALDEKQLMTFSSQKIVKYIDPGDNFWSFEKVGLGLTTLSHINFDLNKEEYKKFLDVVFPITYDRLFKYYFKKRNKKGFRNYKMTYHTIYFQNLNTIEKIKYYFYSIILYLNEKRK